MSKPTYLPNIQDANYPFTYGSRLVYGCSGLGGVWGETNYDAHETIVDYSASRMKQSVEESLETLGVDSVDLLFLHEPYLVPLDRIEEILETLRGFVDAGYTKLIGAGGNPTDGFRPFITKENFQVVSGFLKVDACNLTGFKKDIPHV